MRKSILGSDGAVVNVILVAEDWQAPEGLLIGTDGGEIGDRWDGTQYIRPPALEPEAPADTPSAPDIGALKAENAALKARQAEFESLMRAMAKQMEAMKVVTDSVQATAAKVDP